MYQDIKTTEKHYHTVKVKTTVKGDKEGELKQVYKLKQLEHRPCLFLNDKGGWHIQGVNVTKGRVFQSTIKKVCCITQ